MVEPIEFINQIKDSDNYIQSIYMNGGCYQLYKVLKVLYPEAEAYKVKLYPMDTHYNHVITLINNKYYDIKGEVNINELCGIEAVKNKDIEELEKWSFAKQNWLYRECPICGELVFA